MLEFNTILLKEITMKQRILIMRLPGSGKTMLAESLKKYLEQNGAYTKWNVACNGRIV
jgi:MoxR-like ATPase